MLSQLTSSLRKLSVRARDAFPGKPLVTVFGATGAQGSSVAVALVESGRFRVRGVTRNTDSERARRLRDGGVEVVRADMAQRDQVLQALEGAYAAYVGSGRLGTEPGRHLSYRVTDFWTVREAEFEMGKTAVECAKEAGVKHLVWSTLPDTAALSGGEINVPHFVSKAKVDAVVEAQHFQYYTFVMCAFYFQNFAQFGLTALGPEAAEEGGKGGKGAALAAGVEAGGKGAMGAVGAEEELEGAEGVETVGKGKGEEGAEETAEAEGGEPLGVDSGDTAGKGSGDTAGKGAGNTAGKGAGGAVSGARASMGGSQGAAASRAPVIFRLPMKADDMLTSFDVDDTGNAVLAILENPREWHGRRVCLAGYHAPAAEYARVFETVKKRKASFETVPADNEELNEMFKWFSARTVFGPYDLTNGRKCYPKLKSWEEWLVSGAWSGPKGTAEAAASVAEGPKPT